MKADRTIRGGWLPIATMREHYGWDVRLHACPDCEIGRWRVRVQHMVSYLAKEHAPIGLNFTELQMLHSRLRDERGKDRSLAEAARAIPITYASRDRILHAVDLASVPDRQHRSDAPAPEREAERETQEVMF